MNLSSKAIAGVKDQGNFLQAGVHNATFKGIDKDTFTSQGGENFTTMAITFDIEGFGEYKHRLFEPKSTDRQDNSWGQSPSQVEQFFVTLKHVFDTVNPTVGKQLGDGTSDIEGNFEQIIAKCKTYAADFVGKTTKVKMLPQKSGFNQFPSYPARITQNSGNLVLGTKFIGEDLTLSAYELQAIEKAKNARPTDMKTQGGSPMNGAGAMGALADMATAGDIDDLPF